MRTVRPALWNARPLTGWTENREVLTTTSGSRLYVHLVREPPTSTVVLAPQTRLPLRARLMNTGAPLTAVLVDLPSRHQRPPSRVLCVRGLPTHLNRNAGWIIELEYDGHPPATDASLTAACSRLSRGG